MRPTEEENSKIPQVSGSYQSVKGGLSHWDDSLKAAGILSDETCYSLRNSNSLIWRDFSGITLISAL